MFCVQVEPWGKAQSRKRRCVCLFRSVRREDCVVDSAPDVGSTNPTSAGRGAAGPHPPAERAPDSVHDVGVGVLPHAEPIRLGEAACVPAPEPVRDARPLPAGAAGPHGHAGLLPEAGHGDALLHFLLHGGHQGAVPRRQGAQEAELEVPHQVHDVVPEARGAQDHQ